MTAKPRQGGTAPLPATRSTLADVAARASVSLATADRVINERKHVRDGTRQKVLAAAMQLEYLPEGTLARMVRPPPSRLVFILPKGANRFMTLLSDYVQRIEEQLAPYNIEGRVRWVDAFDPELLAKELLNQRRKADGLVVVPLEHPLVREAVNRVVGGGMPVITLASDLTNSQRTAYVGLDNYAAGRSAGLMMGRWCDREGGKVAMICGSLSYRGHGERELGFQHLLQEEYPSLRVTGLREGHDDPQRSYQQTRELIAQHKDLVGIYNVGGGSDGVGRALREAGLARKVNFLGHELTPETRGFLVDGTMVAVIHQNPQLEVMNCVRILANLREGKKPQEGIEPLRISLLIRENLP